MDDIKSYDSFQADRVGGNKPTKTNITNHILKEDPSKRDKVDKLNKMGHVPLGQQDHRQDLQCLKEI